MGRVVAATDPHLRREVAVKILLDPNALSPAQLDRFVAEAQITSQLEHPNIVPIYEMGWTDEGELFFVMRKVEGQSLADVIDWLKLGDPEMTRRWTLGRLLAVFVSLCNAVGFAHSKGVLHRDLKPANVLLGPFGEVLLTDWGVARLIDATSPEIRVGGVAGSEAPRTAVGSVVGTPGYIPPDQLDPASSSPDRRTDVWSLGAVLYNILTLRRAVPGRSSAEVLEATLVEPIEDPRARARGRRIPDELAEIVERALERDPGARYQTADALGEAVQGFLDGSERAARALEQLAQAEGAWVEYCAMDEHRATLVASERELSTSFDPWQSLEEKQALVDVRLQLDEIEPERASLFGRAIGGAERALAQDPGSGAARAFLARAYWSRFLAAELAGDRADMRYYSERAEEYDDGDLADARRGEGALTLRTDPPGAEVVCERFDRRGYVWPLVERTSLGVTPLEAVPMAMGSYRLTIRSPGKRDTIYPVHITRRRHWSSGPEPLPLFSDEEIGAAFVYVPAGRFLCGADPEAKDPLPTAEPHVDGFFVGRVQVTQGAYAEYLNHLHRTDPEAAWRSVPRQVSGLDGTGGQFWPPPVEGIYKPPEADRDGDEWLPEWPVFGLNWLDVVAYVAWRAKRDGLDWRIPTELQWEKAARGVDGRHFPWGDRADPSLFWNQLSERRSTLPIPVGTHPSDRSIYGVMDMAGLAREVTAPAPGLGVPPERCVRSAGWPDANPVRARCASRSPGIPEATIHGGMSFRLLRALPTGPRD